MTVELIFGSVSKYAKHKPTLPTTTLLPLTKGRLATNY